ncbi:MAG: tetratricopeptide repeat protein [Proteobacteria bacterium]|nr:tetratricopeptide repeat protein [Pseudomonadota bacterium]
MDWNFALVRARAGICQVFGLNVQALEIYRQLLAVYEDAPCARVAAILAAKTGKLEEAEGWYTKAAAWMPDDVETWFNLGYLRDALGRKREAMEAFQRAVQLAPHFDRAWHGIGSMRIALGEHAQAIEPLRKAHELQPSAQLLYLMGTCQHVCGNERAVRNTVQELVKLDMKRARLLVEETGRKDLLKLLEVD